MEFSLTCDAAIEGWVHALDLRARETGNHSWHVAELALRLAQAAGITGEVLKIAQLWYSIQNEQGEQQGHGCAECNG